MMKLENFKKTISSHGVQVDRFFKRVTVVGKCWEFSEIAPHTGYGIFHSNGTTWRAHRWIIWAKGGIEIKDKRCVLHSCDNRRCVNPKHLRLGDRYDNAQDIKRRGRTHLIRDPKLGSKNHQSKLTEKKVLQIRKYLALGKAGKELAREFGVCQAVISEIKTRKLWSHI